MSNKIIETIIDNFNAQHQLYIKMSELSAQQLQKIESGAALKAEDLNEILEARQDLLESISGLNLRNKELQWQAVQEMELEEFILSQVKPKSEQGQFQELSDIVKELGQVLRTINETDEKIQYLIKQELIQGPRHNPKSSSRQAGAAYRQAMKQGKPKS